MKRIQELFITLRYIVTGAFFFFPSLVSATIVSGGNNSFQLENPLAGSNINSFCGLINAILKAFLEIGLPIAVLFVVLAGARFVTARGDTTKLKDARTNLLNTILGIALFFGAAIIVGVIINTIGQFRGVPTGCTI